MEVVISNEFPLEGQDRHDVRIQQIGIEGVEGGQKGPQPRHRHELWTPNIRQYAGMRIIREEIKQIRRILFADGRIGRIVLGYFLRGYITRAGIHPDPVSLALVRRRGALQQPHPHPARVRHALFRLLILAGGQVRTRHVTEICHDRRALRRFHSRDRPQVRIRFPLRRWLRRDHRRRIREVPFVGVSGLSAACIRVHSGPAAFQRFFVVEAVEYVVAAGGVRFRVREVLAGVARAGLVGLTPRDLYGGGDRGRGREKDGRGDERGHHADSHD
mmetsp:Transcript_437/g.1012  ORF Transcript_437/g.1012 Transcript_437/m.1012 type:complete len:273 (+) Transcript_437:454-1272(+)